MKKHLLVSTAIIALTGAAALDNAAWSQAAPRGMPGGGAVKLGVGGYMEHLVGYADNEESVVGASRSVDVTTESEIWFKGWARLPNGLEIIADVQLEGSSFDFPGRPQTSGNDQIDENYFIVRGNFGQVILGSEDNAAYLMTIGYNGVWATSVGETLTFSVDEWILRPAGITQATGPKEIQDANISGTAIDNDSEKISYFTPRFNGIQFGVSYIPDNTQDLDANLTETNYHNGWALGVNYVLPFQGGEFAVGGGYLTFDAPNGSGLPDPEAWNIVTRLAYQNWVFAFGYKEQEDMFPTRQAFISGTAPAIAGTSVASSTNSLDGESWTAGVRYIAGQYELSAGYLESEREGSLANSNEDTFKVVQLSAATEIANGVRLMSNFYWGRFEEEAGVDSTGWALNAGMRLTF